MSDKKKHLVIIVNPKSGVEREKEIKNAVYDHLDHEQYSYEIIHTKYAKHGIELAAEAAKQGVWIPLRDRDSGKVNVNILQ